jgi:hypothetical protein
MDSLAGPFAIAAAVLALAGVRKLLDPASTQGALREMGLPWRGPVVPLLAVAEILTGCWALVEGSRPSALLLALWYAAFTVFVVVALRRDTPLSSCGCIGRPDTPPTIAHVVVDAVFALVALGVAADPYGPVDQVLTDQPWAGVPFLLWFGVGVYVVYLVLAVLPITLGAAQAVRSPSSRGPHRHPGGVAP